MRKQPHQKGEIKSDRLLFTVARQVPDDGMVLVSLALAYLNATELKEVLNMGFEL